LFHWLSRKRAERKAEKANRFMVAREACHFLVSSISYIANPG